MDTVGEMQRIQDEVFDTILANRRRRGVPLDEVQLRRHLPAMMIGSMGFDRPAELAAVHDRVQDFNRLWRPEMMGPG